MKKGTCSADQYIVLVVMVLFLLSTFGVIDLQRFGDWVDGVRHPPPVSVVAAEESIQRDEVNSMASYVFTGAGSTDYNGTYNESGTYNGQPAYTNGTCWLYWAYVEMGNPDGWSLGASKGDTGAYAGSGLTALPASPWSVGLGTAPAPSVIVAASYIMSIIPLGGDVSQGHTSFEVQHSVGGIASASGSVQFDVVIKKPDGSVFWSYGAWFGGTVFSAPTASGLGSIYLDGPTGSWSIEVTATPYLDPGVIGTLVFDSESFTLFNYNYTPDPDPPVDPDPGDSDLSIYGVYIDDGAGNDVEVADTEARVGCYVVEGGADTLSYIKYDLYKNGALVATYTDSSAVAGANEHTFSSLSFATGDILKVIAFAYDILGDYTFGSFSCGVGGVKNKSIVIGDAAADFSGWTLTDIDLVDTDNLELANAGSFYKLAGSISLVFDSGYDATVWDMIAFTTYLPTNTGITFKVRTASTQAGLATATLSSAISLSGQLLSSLVDANRWIEIIAYLVTTDNTVTPILYSTEIFYSADAGDSSSKKWDTTAELEEATLVDLVVDSGLLTLDGVTTYEYEADGFFIVRIDSGAFVNWLTLVAELTTPTGTEIKFKSRSFNDPISAGDSDWSAEFSSGDSIPSVDALFLDIMCLLRTSDTAATPVVTSISVDFQKEVEPSNNYVYTTQFILPSRLGSLLLADLQNSQDPACFVQYRYAVNDDTDWDDMLPITKNTFVKVLSDDYLSGEKIRVAAKLVSSSVDTEAVLDELGIIIALENGKMLQIL